MKNPSFHAAFMAPPGRCDRRRRKLETVPAYCRDRDAAITRVQKALSGER